MTRAPTCVAYYLVAVAIGERLGKPLPAGLNTTEIGDWTLTINCSPEPIDGVQPWNVRAVHRQFIVVALFGPDGGLIGGGMTEDEFIADISAHVPEELRP